jgi:hypothetical protein
MSIKITEFDSLTKNLIEREANAEEILNFELMAEEAEIKKAEAEARKIQREAILDRLGLTADEAKLLLG